MTSHEPVPTSLSRRAMVAASAAILALAGVAVTAESADAQSRSRSRSVTVSGPNHSATRNAEIYRSPGSTTVSRSGTIGGQPYSGSRSRTTVATGDGYATTATHTGPAGNTQTRTGQVTVDENGYSRSSEVQTSGGYGYERDADVYRDESGAVITRGVTTNSGASRSSTVVRTRPD
ncbi:MAG: hypothetical protein DCF29_00720 [Alphaproteobacteria bacterium]|uniref:hypothetical protein n=1 Tax=Brevundimonas sp. BAL3 TaxID=391600 RepID=UPI00058ED95D|nr:hypothetical protein [Brevundimonas sp. BAL3]PZO09163.1 MAG: hypothetical protein DCF29_00720 [Alphaproteobacteria bacterium]